MPKATWTAIAYVKPAEKHSTISNSTKRKDRYVMGVKRIRKFQAETVPPSTPEPASNGPAVEKTLGLTWKTERRKVADLVAFQGNPRQMTAKQAEDLTASLQRFNLAEIPAINVDNTVLAGHQRLKVMAAIGRGNEVIDVRVPSRKLTPTEAREYLIRSNKNVGEWSWDELANFDAVDLEAWGFDPDELTKNLEEDGEHAGGNGSEQAIADDKAATLQKKWKTAAGQLWTTNDNAMRILCGDATDPKVWTRLMQGQKACLCNTDPPYGVSYKGSTKKWQVIEGDKKRDDDLMSNILIPAFRLMLQHTEADAAYYIWHGSSTRVANGLRISDGHGNQLAVVPQPPKAKKTRLIRMDAGDTLSVMTAASTTAWQIARTDIQNRLHPNQKPTALFRIPIANHTAPGDLVVEPFAGSGGQFVAAHETGRRCWGLEIDPRFCAVVLERLTTECGLEPRQEKA